MTIATVIAAFLALGTAASVWAVRRLVAPLGESGIHDESASTTGAMETERMRKELETLREMVLQLRLELSDSRREVAEVRREQGTRANPRDLDLIERRKLADERSRPRVAELYPSDRVAS